MDNTQNDRQYFGVYFPEPTVSVGRRYFFFKSLANTELGGIVSGLLSSNMSKIDPNDSEGLKIVKSAMNFLKTMIENEQSNEKEYYEINIINNEKLPESMRNECKTLFASANLNYIEFINLINKYYEGVTTYQQNLQYESTRLHKLQTLYEKFAQHYTQNEDGSYTIKVKNKDTNLFEDSKVSFYQAFRDFLLQGSKKDVEWISAADRQFGFDTKTIANTLQNKFQSIYNQIWDNIDFRNSIESVVTKQGLEGYEKYLTAKMIQEFMHESQGVILDSFKNKEFKTTLNKTDIKNFIHKFLDNLSLQPGKTVEDKIENSLLSSVKSEAQSLLSAEYQITNSSNRIIKSIDTDVKLTVNRKGTSIDNLSSDIINLIQDILTEKQKNSSISEKKIWNREELFDALSKAFPEQELKLSAKKYDLNKLVNIMNELIKNQKMITVKIAEKDNIISEGINSTGIQHAPTLWNRIKNIILTFGTQKSDVAGIEIGKIDILPTNINWSTIADQITNNFIQSLDINDVEIKSTNFSFDEKTFRQKHNLKKKEFSIEAETLRRIALKEKQIEDTINELKSRNAKADEINAVLNHLKTSVQIGSTVKSYNKYNNKEGFHGGSLGGSVETQLANLYKMFEYGNVAFTPEDMEWLTFAIYNAGPGLLGAHLKNPIENILSTIAVMLMFDDAGQQAMYLNDQIKARYELSSYNSAKFLHLYYLNGTYYPASFILQLTYNGLLKAYTQLEAETLKGTEAFNSVSNGSRANIINPVSESNEVGTKVNNDTVTTKQSQWGATFAANAKSVKIQVTFLAGMLDIIDILNNSLM